MTAFERNPFQVPFPPSQLCKEDSEIAKMVERYRSWIDEQNVEAIFAETNVYVYSMKLRIASLISSGSEVELDPFCKALQKIKVEADTLCKPLEP